ncbi:hypothetical protein BST43_13505 [Mycobacteroides saopaulense]|uniref:Iron-binding zinc finger CDGSH type domain-containing protein n=2 Tax=Mycobacteroides saopaulense TaxID=1578165 RepID=A0A1X0J3I6_9MYCO|nr:CDGSH iron-sulfur domain-containing protein [Mycobacteroides saopaulense]ORB56480.1 hypothetical protein BST43_13505 [Mycobacteroides saopaulense]
MSHRDRRAIRIVPSGPMMIEGPVEIQLLRGETVTSDRFQVAICMCHKSSCYPLCDTSHRGNRRTKKRCKKR